MIPEIQLGDKLVCPVCGKEFTVTEDTKYIIKDAYTCDWKCFRTEVKRREMERNNTK